MPHRHPRWPGQWLFTDERLGEELWPLLQRLPCGSGVIIRQHGAASRRDLVKRILQIGRARGLVVVDEAGGAVARVHNAGELRQALLQRKPLIFVSPLYATRSHRDLRPMPRMRAATLARLANRRAFALGGMNRQRFRTVQPLGFIGWGAIDAWLSRPSREGIA